MKPKQKRMTLLGFLLLTLIVSFYLSHTTKVASAVDEAPQGPAACLSCHGGSFDKLADKKPGFKTESGVLVNPHQFIPHNEKKAENVPKCLDCHTPHPNPPKEKIELSKVNVETCYVSCHHLRNFEKCSKCHPNRK
jgi:hypothetical protein